MTPEMLIAMLAPVGIALIKRLSQLLTINLPSAILPLMAPVLGVALSYLMPLLGLVDPVSIAAGAAAGLAGVGVREITDQTRKAVTS